MKSIPALILTLVLALASSSQAQVPQLINYQGRIIVGGTNFTGAGQFKFALVNNSGTVTFWSNNGTSAAGSEPSLAVSIPVANGLYSVLLGDATLPNMTVVPATVFTNGDVRLRIWFNGGAGSQLLTPDQRIAAVGYAMMAANVADGAITAAKLAPGVLTATNLATNSIGSVQLADAIALGASNTVAGRLDIFRTSANTPAITLDGAASQISTFGSDGLEQIRLWGAGFGELYLNNSGVGNQRAVQLSANGTSGGFLSLNNSNASVRASLSGANSGGSLSLYQADGAVGAFVDGDASGSGYMDLRNTNGSTRLNFYGGGTFNGGEIELRGSNGLVRLELFGNAPEVITPATASGGGGINLYESDGTRTISLRGSDEFNTGGELKMFNSAGALVFDIDSGSTTPFFQIFDGSGTANNGVTLSTSTSSGTTMTFRDTTGVTSLVLDGHSIGSGGEISVRDTDGTETVEILGAEAAGQGPQLLMREADGSTSIELDGEVGTGGGGYLRLYNGAGVGTITLQADQGGSGRITTQVLQITGGSDLSEQFDIKALNDTIKPGMVVCIDPENPGELVMSTRAYDRTAAGIVSGAGGINSGMVMGQQGSVADGKHPVALTGRVYCMVDASNGAIRAGDLLTTSKTPGHAMKVGNHGKAQGAIIGKAMSSLKNGKGLVLVLVSLQ